LKFRANFNHQYEWQTLLTVSGCPDAGTWHF
jgi:hypothetical protein